MDTPEAYKMMEADRNIIQAIREPLQEASPRLLSLVGRFTEAGRIADAKTALTYSIALQDIISYLFKLTETDIERKAGAIKAEIAETTKAVEQIRRWRAK
jgi:hypothetical protein